MTLDTRSRTSVRRPQGSRGVSLIVAMLMLVIIGLASAAAIRNATSADRAINNNRLQTQANQYAQVALQFCERQLTLPAGRVINVPTVPPKPPAWTVKENWFDDAPAAYQYTLKTSNFSSGVRPAVPPQCMVEPASTTLPHVYIVTARGFSDDFTQDPHTRATVTGSVVWLQSMVYL